VEQAKGAEMLILGAVSGAARGSTADYCLRFAPCPVAYVPI
jgi:nucleotide-binding universal stress UspA family protein